MLGSDEVILFLRQIDEVICQHHLRALDAILIGGSEITFFSGGRQSKDVDIIIPSFSMHPFSPLFWNHFRKKRLVHVLSLVPLAYILKVDIFLSCDLPSANVKDYKEHCLDVRGLNGLNPKSRIRLPNFRKLKVQFLHPVDLICVKIFARRLVDLEDCKRVTSTFPKITPEQVIERLIQIDKKRGNYPYYQGLARSIF